MNGTVQASIILGSPVVAFFLGILLGNSLRMKEYGWKLGVIFATVALGLSLIALRPIKQGIDLSGGVILIYEVDEQKTSEAALAKAGEDLPREETTIRMPDLIQALQKRINPTGVKEVDIRPYGDKQVEIIIPDVSDSEIEVIKESIITAGFLKFRIVANQDRNPYEWELAQGGLLSQDPQIRTSTFVKNEDGEIIGEWVRLAREEIEMPEGQLPPLKFDDAQVAGMLTREFVPGEIEAFVLIDPLFNVEGRHLRVASADFDQNAQPCVSFQMTQEGAVLFGGLTNANLPNEAGIRAQLGIIMDGELLSAPGIKTTIRNNGVIEGNFTQEEIDFLVRILRAGKLPAVLREDPISQNKINPLLGEDTIRKGKLAIGASLMAVLIFMLLYYHFPGIVACMALVTNLILIVGLMILIQAAFTLPGLAGLVLTVGMSVDANVLIFERIREELKRGAALRMAIRNGFGKAMSTIVDANMTTLLVAIVLYVVGTETIKGFAITLILGILMSMYTAIFCSRVTFDIAERKKWISKLRMAQILGETNIDFLGMRKAAAVCSIIAILVGLTSVVLRGKDILDIDFTGGTSVQVMLIDPMKIEDVRSRLNDANIADDISVTQVKPEGQPDDTVYKIDTSIENERDLQARIQDVFMDESGRSLLKSHRMEFTPPEPLQTSFLPDPRPSLDGQLLAYAGGRPRMLAQVDQVDSAQPPTKETDEPLTSSETGAVAAETTPAETTPAETTPAEAGGSGTTATDGSSGLEYLSETELTFDEKIGARALRKMMQSAAENDLKMAVPRMDITHPDWNGRDDQGFSNWKVRFTTDAGETNKLLTYVREGLSNSPIWLSSSKIGSKVAGDMTTAALMAIFVCLLGIVAYIWIRFQRVSYGLAAVVALLHDVTIVLGVVALSLWMSQFLGFLLIDEFKISLPIVAAFLTIIGYSLNDTIVVFDRIREVKGKSPNLTKEMINASINQTLSRTLLTSVTTLIVVGILYVFGGQGIHGFAFALLFGVLVGTYSSIFVASPSLLWMTRFARKRQTQSQKPKKASVA